jgi:hypothetical protein
MLIGFGISIFFLIIPNLIPVFNSIGFESNTDDSTIDNDLNNLQRTLNSSYSSNIDSHTIQSFNYSGDISVVIENHTDSSQILLFRFSKDVFPAQNFPNASYRKIMIDPNVNVNITSIFISNYEIFISNNSLFLTFY